MPLELWCLFFAGLLHMLTKIPLSKAQNDAGGYDNSDPRSQQAALDGWGKRALAAHQNQIESFPLFAAGVLVATLTQTSSDTVGYLCLLFIACRLAFVFLYLKNIATARSLVWIAGYLCTLALLCSPAWA